MGIAHASDYFGASNASYVGWAASDYPELQSEITGAGAQYTNSGVINPLNFPPVSDPRFPFSIAYGPADPTAAFAFDINPNATTARMVFLLDGEPTIENDALFRNGFE